MRADRPVLRFFLDEGVPVSVGRVFKAAGHEVMFFEGSMAKGSPDHAVAIFAEINDAILVALDGDMKRIARGYGVGGGRYRRLSLIKLSWREPQAAARVQTAMSLIEHEWMRAADGRERRLFIEIQNAVIRTMR